MPLTRRDFVKLAGAGGLAAATLRCGDNNLVIKRDLAVAVLEPSTSALTVAVWARTARSVTIAVRDGVELSLALSEAGIGSFDLTGLAPGTRYEITVTADDGSQLGPYVASTAPADDDRRLVRFAIVADVDPNPMFDTDLTAQLIAAAPDLVLGIGDWPYCDNGPDVAMTVDAYRDRHSAARTVPKLQAVHQAAGMRAIYDDHEFRNNWDAMLAAAEPDRYRAALQVWDEFFPVRGAVGEVRYRNWRWGAQVECFMLDCRRFRSANADPDGPNKTMLGATQFVWLLDAIARSTATFKLVLTSIPLDFSTGGDGWSTFLTERNRLLTALVGTPGLLFVTADQHWFASHQLAFGTREFQFGPLCRGIGVPGPQQPGEIARVTQYNVGILEFEQDTVLVTAIGPGGQRLYAERLTADALTPR